MDINSVDISSGHIRIRFRKKGLARLNNALRKKALSAHPPQVVIAYKGTFYFSPYVMLPLSEETGLKLPDWLPQEIFTWSQ